MGFDLYVFVLFFIYCSTENCVWLVPVVAPYPQCAYQLSDCQSIVCIAYYSYIEKVTLSLDSLCADPLSVEFVAMAGNDTVFEGNFTESSQFDYGYFMMERNATQLNVSVSILSFRLLTF